MVSAQSVDTCDNNATILIGKGSHIPLLQKQLDDDVDMIMNGLKKLPPRQLDDTLNGVIVGLVN